MITNERQKTTHSSQFLDQRARSPSGHEDQFPRPTLSARSRFGQRTFAETQSNGLDAPNEAFGRLPQCIPSRLRLAGARKPLTKAAIAWPQ